MRRAAWWLLSLVLGGLVLVCAGCRWAGSMVGMPMCHRVKDAPDAPINRTPPPAHPDFERLRAYRNYYSIGKVGAYEHHFAVWFDCVEQSVAYYAVSPTGEVRRAGASWGGLAVRDGEPPEIPDDQRDNARAVLARHAGDYDHESSVRAEYLGSYREVFVTELVPTSLPGDPHARMVWHAEATLRASADLGSITGVAGMSGGETRMCWRDTDYRDCTEQAWIDFAPENGGVVELLALASPRSKVAPAERARFQEAVLAAARRRLAGQPGAPLDGILARQGDALLPPGLAQTFQAGFTLYARPAEGSGATQAEAAITAEIPARDALKGVAHGVARGTIAGVAVTAEIEIALDGHPEVPEHGEAPLTFRVRYRLTDSRGNTRSAEVAMTAKLLLDGDTVVPRWSELPQEVTGHPHEPPLGQHLPGAGPFRQIDAYLGVGAPSASPAPSD